MADLFSIKSNRSTVTIQGQKLEVRGLSQTQCVQLKNRFPEIEGIEELDFENVADRHLEVMHALVAGMLGHFGRDDAEVHVAENFDAEDMVAIIAKGTELMSAKLSNSFGERSASDGRKPSAKPRAKAAGGKSARASSKA